MNTVETYTVATILYRYHHHYQHCRNIFSAANNSLENRRCVAMLVHLNTTNRVSVLPAIIIFRH